MVMMILMQLLLMKMKNMKLLWKSSIRPQSDLSLAMNFAWFLCTSVCVTNVPQAPPYGPSYGRRLHTVHTMGHTATLKTVQDIPGLRTQLRLTPLPPLWAGTRPAAIKLCSDSPGRRLRRGAAGPRVVKPGQGLGAWAMAGRPRSDCHGAARG